MSRNITIAQADDWIGVYINGELQAEGHSISTVELLEVLGVEHEQVSVDQEWIEDRGNLPANLADVVKEMPL